MKSVGAGGRQRTEVVLKRATAVCFLRVPARRKEVRENRLLENCLFRFCVIKEEKDSEVFEVWNEARRALCLRGRSAVVLGRHDMQSRSSYALEDGGTTELIEVGFILYLYALVSAIQSRSLFQ